MSQRQASSTPAPRWRLLIGLLWLPALAQAWGPLGHRAVAELAEQRIAPATRAALQPLLHEAGARRLADIALWADDAREQPAYRETFWLHFVNHADGARCRYRAERDCPDGACVIAAVDRYRAELADPELPLAQRTEALKFLVHFVGDIHQPLHAGRGSDKGGNTWQLRIRGQGSNLHKLWDDVLPSSRGLRQRDYVALLAATPLPAAGPRSPRRWARESCELVEGEGFYPPHKFDLEGYLARYRPIAEQRLRLAAVRLARDLDRALATRR